MTTCKFSSPFFRIIVVGNTAWLFGQRNISFKLSQSASTMVSFAEYQAVVWCKLELSEQLCAIFLIVQQLI